MISKRFQFVVLVVVAMVFWLSQSGEIKLQSSTSESQEVTKKELESQRSPASVGFEQQTMDEQYQKIQAGTSDSAAKDPVLGDDQVAQKFTRLFQLTKAISTHPQGYQEQQAYLARLKMSSSYALDLRSMYDRIKDEPGQENEVAGLLQLMQEASQNDDSSLKQELVHQIAEREMLSRATKKVIMPSEAESQEQMNESLSTDQSMILPVVAHEVFLKTTDRDQVRFNGTVDAIQKQDNHNVRTAMFEAYASTNPARRKEMLDELSRLNVPMAVRE